MYGALSVQMASIGLVTVFMSLIVSSQLWYPPSQRDMQPLSTCGTPVLSRATVGHVRSRKRGSTRILLTSLSLRTMVLSFVTSAKIVVTT
jgi:hypothetical protein